MPKCCQNQQKCRLKVHDSSTTSRDVPAGRYAVHWVMAAGPQGMLPGVTRFTASVPSQNRGFGVTFSYEFGVVVPPKEGAVDTWKEFMIGEITLFEASAVKVGSLSCSLH